MNNQTLIRKILKIIALGLVFHCADGLASLSAAISCRAEVAPNQIVPSGFIDNCIAPPSEPAASVRAVDDATIFINHADQGIIRNSSYAYAWASYGRLDVDTSTDLFFFNSSANATGSASAKAAFSDYITVLSDVLPVGTPVELNVRIGLGYIFEYGLTTQPYGEGEFSQHIDTSYRVGTLTGSFDTTYQPDFGDILVASGAINERNSDSSANANTYQVSAKIGEILPVSAQLNASSSLTGARSYVDGLSYRGYSKISASTLEERGLSLTIDAITAEVILLAMSGHNYSITPVPEPSTTILLSAGLLLLGLCKMHKLVCTQSI